MTDKPTWPAVWTQAELDDAKRVGDARFRQFVIAPLVARLDAIVAALDTQGFRALPCQTCQRVGDVRVHDLHEVLHDLAFALREPEEP